MALSAATGTYGAWDTAIWDTSTWGPDVVWVDVTKYVRSFNTGIGRQRDTDYYAAGTAGLVLDNWDARFSPDNMSSPYVTAGVTGCRPWRPVRITVTTGGVTSGLFWGFTKSFQESY